MPEMMSQLARRNVIAVVLLWLGAMVAGGIVCASEADLRAAHPALLLPACAGLIWRSHRRSVQRVQAVVFLYLMWTLVAACFDLFWKLPGLAGSSVHISATLPVAVLIGAGWALSGGKWGRPGMNSRVCGMPLLVALVLLGVHMLFLLVLLRGAYGFGWEEDGAVLGRVGLCAVVLCGLGPAAHAFAFRTSLSVMITLVLLTRSLP